MTCMGSERAAGLLSGHVPVCFRVRVCELGLLIPAQIARLRLRAQAVPKGHCGQGHAQLSVHSRKAFLGHAFGVPKPELFVTQSVHDMRAVGHLCNMSSERTQLFCLQLAGTKVIAENAGCCCTSPIYVTLRPSGVQAPAPTHRHTAQCRLASMPACCHVPSLSASSLGAQLILSCSRTRPCATPPPSGTTRTVQSCSNMLQRERASIVRR